MRIEQIANSCLGKPQPIQQPRKKEILPAREEVDDFYKLEHEEGENSAGTHKKNGRGKGERNQDDNISGMKVKIPTSQGK